MISVWGVGRHKRCASQLGAVQLNAEPFIVMSEDSDSLFKPTSRRQPKAWRVWSNGVVEYKTGKGRSWERVESWDREFLAYIVKSYVEDLRTL